MDKRKWIIIISGFAIVAFAFLSMTWLSGFKKDPPKRPPVDIIRYVKAEPIVYKNTTTNILATGRVTSKSEIVLSAEVSGKILPGNIPFKKGQSFKKGTLLIRIYDDEAILSLMAQKSGFLNRIASILPDFKLSYKESYPDWKMYLEIIEIDKDLPELPEIRSPQEKVFLASRNLLGDYYSIKKEELRLKKHSIYAPFDGAITTVKMEVGAIANPGTQLANIINTTDLELEVPVDVNSARWLNNGDVVKVHNESKTSEWLGRIIRKSNEVEVATQSISLFVNIKSTRAKPVYKGQYLIAEFSGIKLDHVMEIPRSAVFNSNEVFVVADTVLQKKEIVVKKVNQKTLFFSGLEEGLDIVVEPLISANENTKVKILGREEKISDGKKQSEESNSGNISRKGN